MVVLGSQIGWLLPAHNSLALSELQIHPSCQGVGGLTGPLPTSPTGVVECESGER